MTPAPDVRIYPGLDELAHAAASFFVEQAMRALAEKNWFSALLCGGSTPVRTYELLARPGFSAKLNWSSIHLFWGDERCVPADHPASNYRMACEAWLDKALIPLENVHRIHGELDCTLAARSYEDQLRFFFNHQGESAMYYDGINQWPRFDLIFLGIGEDGHTASLFPNHPALEEARAWAVYVKHNRPPAPLVDRISVTMPLINASRCVLFLATGEEKAEIIRRVVRSGEGSWLPADQVRPVDGELIWMLDQAAARLL